MALSKPKLYNAILSIFQTKRMELDPDADPPFSTLREVSPNMLIFAKELSDAYNDYAQDSETYAANSLIANGKTVMKTILETLEATGNTPVSVALTISNSIQAYWGVCAYALAPFPPGFSLVHTITITPPTTPSFAGIQSAIMSGGEDTIQANLWAEAIDSQTKSVKTTHIGLDTTVPTPLPKTDSNKPIS